MPDPAPLTYAELQPTVAALALSPAELHGGLCGLVCGGGVPEPRRWLSQLHIDPTGLDGVAIEDLEQMRRQTLADLSDEQLSFQPLLPEDNAGMETRVRALSDWCAGFLGGFGLTGADKAGFWSEDARDALNDLERIARFGYEASDAEEDETALTEVQEFVRVAVLLLRQESQPLHAPTGATRH